MSVAGLMTVRSSFGPRETAERLEEAAKSHGMVMFVRIDHAAGAVQVGESLRPTELLVFGHAKGGTPLMQCVQTSGIDLPLKALVWQDRAGDVWLSYNDPVWLAERHSIGIGATGAVSAIATALDSIARETVAPNSSSTYRSPQ